MYFFKRKPFLITILVILLICLLRSYVSFDLEDRVGDNLTVLRKEVIVNDLNKIREHYSEFVKTVDGAELYVKKDNMYESVAKIYGSIELQLDSFYDISDEYYKLLDSDFYIRYDMVSSIDTLSPLIGEFRYYKNYVVFNENIILKDKAKLYVDGDNYYEVDGGNFPIIIKDDDRYGVEYNHRLVYVSKMDVMSVVTTDSSLEYADGVSVLNYHYTVSSSNENGELDECKGSICITDTMFDRHIRYLKENGYYSASIRDLELFIDGKIRLPKRSVVLTIDDGWYVARSIQILEKYQMHATLFLIGSLASPDDYRSDYLEIHSHTWNMHTIGQCPSSIGRGGILCLSEEEILEDLKKSRDSLHQTSYFCYPFYEYNNRAIELLKKAGFTMAFAGEKRDSTVRVGQDKFKIPRYVIVSYTTMNDFIRYVS